MYYPKNQIETNLYSRDELVFVSTKEYYTGLYFKTSDGRYFTGKEPNDGPNYPLMLPPLDLDGQDEWDGTNASPLTFALTTPPDYRFTEENTNYSILTKQPQTPSFSPVPYFPILTSTDKINGYFTRYFVKKTNENIYMEVNKRDFIRTVSIPLYIPISLNWVIKGERNKVFNINQKQVLFTEQKYKIIGLKTFLNNDYLQFYQGLI